MPVKAIEGRIGSLSRSHDPDGGHLQLEGNSCGLSTRFVLASPRVVRSKLPVSGSGARNTLDIKFGNFALNASERSPSLRAACSSGTSLGSTLNRMSDYGHGETGRSGTYNRQLVLDAAGVKAPRFRKPLN
jgi:hypothetical protein